MSPGLHLQIPTENQPNLTIVSLLLHVNDFESEVREASRETLRRVFTFFEKSALTRLCTEFLEDNFAAR